jgi:hypothetical protein
LLSFHHFVARACVFCNTKQDDSQPPPRRSKAKEKGKQPDTREERKKETIKQTDRQTREKERKKIREQSECEPAAPHPGSRVSNRYHQSVGKNQSPGALLLLVLCFGAPCHPLL